MFTFGAPHLVGVMENLTKNSIRKAVKDSRLKVLATRHEAVVDQTQYVTGTKLRARVKINTLCHV